MFIFVFFPAVFIIHWMIKTNQKKYIFLTAASYIFYACWNYKFMSLMLISTLADFFAGKYIYNNFNDIKKRKIGLIFSVCVNLGLLCFFKYYNFFMDSLRMIPLFSSMNPLFLNIILPVGISFYTFQTMSYSIDIYRGKLKPANSFFKFSCYVSLFSQLVAGPIIRYSDIEKDMDNLSNINAAEKINNFHIGVNLFIIGLAKKVIIADTIARVINPLFNSYSQLSSLTTWLIVLGFTYQLYFDFSGYSDMAIGLGHLLGFKFPMNFNSPYKAVNISDFWKRWHISLSTWLKDYVYISWLGGNRINYIRTFFNLMITMLLGGLWHGAGWNFVIWGAYHGILLCTYKLFKNAWDKMHIFFQRGLTFFLVVVGWVFFRSNSFKMIKLLLFKMFSLTSIFIVDITGIKLFVFIAFLTFSFIITNFFKNTNEIKYSKKIIYAILLAIILVICLLLIGENNSPFLYYQF